ncbi:piggyBac transposable element-derived protein 2 [Ixodes scapularis]|uniref:piggyBac transposable element-derived protein 2 n=1 Tax=Ixodes scapularis TaxID=6945 RepID=UPI001A9CBAB4|nr:piggyBac transposable element-derived protein 2 [Ixodes scapularis]
MATFNAANFYGKKKEEPIAVLIPQSDVSEAEMDSSDEEEEQLMRTGKNKRQHAQDDCPIDISLEVEGEGDAEEDQASASAILPPACPKENKRSKKEAPIWKKGDIMPVSSEFTEGFGPPPDELPSPYQYFKMFCDDSVFENFAAQTNLYSVQKTGSCVKTTAKEMEQFVGIHVILGVVKVPSYKMYWSETTRYSTIADVMPRNRFSKLRSQFHIADNSEMTPPTDPDHDRLFKVRPLLAQVSKNLAKVEPEEYNAVDEMIIPFKGRCALKQYLRNKPDKWGIKVFARAGASGFVYSFDVYVGKATITQPSDLGISGDIVIELTGSLPPGKGFKVAFDNWFSSYGLVCALKERGLLSVGTVRPNRLPGCSFKNDQTLKKEGRGSFDVTTEQKGNVVAVKWYDNKSVHLVSSYVGAAPKGQVERWSSTSHSHVTVERPAIVSEYNQFMGGVDLCDMLVELYRCDIRGRRYYLRIVFHLIDVCVVNSWLLYRRHCSQTGTQFRLLVEFRMQIARALLKAGKLDERKRGRPSALETPPPKRANAQPRLVQDVRLDMIGHWPVHSEKKQRCKLCIVSYSRILCGKYNMHLCLNKDKNCFRAFHVK